jgi:predicted ribosomally synthesized peptide with SipW-like signal peptide
MERQTLRIVVVLGMLITLLGGTGVFASFTDRASAGTDSVTSGSRPKSADLRIEPAELNGGVVECGIAGAIPWQEDNTATAQFSLSDVQPGSQLGGSYVCLKNVGSASLTLTASALGLTDLDTDCTGDEAASGDTTCGLDAIGMPQAGELSPLLTVLLDRVVCDSPTMPFANNQPVALDAYTGIDFAGGPLAADDIACIAIQLAYPTPASDVDAQIAQSDQVTWVFAFDGSAS